MFVVLGQNSHAFMLTPEKQGRGACGYSVHECLEQPTWSSSSVGPAVIITPY
jgi:hypothetical protein